MSKNWLLLLFVFCLIRSHAQEVTVSIRVNNPKKDPIAFASIEINGRTDSSFHILKQADSTGTARFKLIKENQYQVRISAVNYQSIEKGILVNNQSQSFHFTAEPAGKTMENVVIISKKPLMRQEDDKTIIETENLAASSTSGYEVIEKTPGLFVDQDGNIYISSLSPATVQINGREMKMSPSDIATILKSLPPAAITRIEIIRTPSAKYDASGTGGMVNVVLKKGVKIGMTGSIHSGMQQGFYGNQFIGFNLNNNEGKKSSFLNLNYSRRTTYEKINTDRIFATDTVLSQASFTKYQSQNYFAGYGLSFPLSDKWDMDVSTSASLNDYHNYSENRNKIKKQSTDQLLSDNLNISSNDGYSLFYRAAVNLKMKIDTLGSEWSNDISYNYSRNESEQAFSTNYTMPFVIITGGDGTSDSRRHYFNAQSDLRLKLKKKFTVETGLKSSLLDFRSVTEYNKEISGIREKDYARTNTFNYEENINAVYLQGSKTIGKDAVIKLGLRMENTNMNGRQLVPGDTSFTINRTDIFPYIYLSKNIMKIMGYSLRAYLVYRRTINRPGYDQLNPFARYVDQYLTEVGNPALRPQFTTNYEANISVDERPILAIGINDTKDIFTNVVYQSDSNYTQSFRTYDNLGNNKEWYLRGLGAIPPGGKYFIVLGAQYNHNFYQGIYENKPLYFKKGTWTFFTYQTLKLDKRSMLTVHGFMRLKGQQQFYELSSFGSLTSSINRKFFKEKLIITMSVNDIFKTNKNDFTIDQGSVHASGTRLGDTRRFGINIRYNFGIKKKEESQEEDFKF